MDINLKTGILKVEENEVLDSLLSFSSRINKKRGFFFVSKVLGKHIPTTPSLMESTYKELAKLVPRSDEKTLFVGFAEAATALGQGVFEALNLPNSFYISFKEEHSHAPSHIFYAPQDPSLQEMLSQITRIVLIDDEVTTGNTANNLIEAFKEVLPKVKTYTLITLLDWSSKKYDNFDIYSLYIL